MNSARREIAFEAFGVRAVLATNSDEAFGRLEGALPPGAVTAESALCEHRLELLETAAAVYDVLDRGELLARGSGLQDALGVAGKALRSLVAFNAPQVVFVHAGVAGHDGRAIVAPGASLAGKSTLVAALVGRGAFYYSDEFAAIDEQGLVHPFPTPLSLRDERRLASAYEIGSLGGVTGREPLRAGLVIVTAYRPGARFDPERLSRANGLLALASHAIPIRQRPEQVMRTLIRAVDRATVLAGERGEAAATAEYLLELSPPAS